MTSRILFAHLKRTCYSSVCAVSMKENCRRDQIYRVRGQ